MTDPHRAGAPAAEEQPMKTPASSWSRRTALKALLAAGAAPMVLPARLFGADAPSKQVTLGCIGVGTHGMSVNLASFLQEPAARVVAVCDVFASRREQARLKVNAQYGGSDCRAVADFRELLADPGIDAVVISTPDHWHVPMSLLALAAGKDVFCEKPTLTIAEGRQLVRAVAERKAVFQTGLEDRSLARYHRLAELVRNGAIGALRHIEVGLPGGALFQKEAAVPPPAELDYNLWLGPAPYQPYSPRRVHSEGWRALRDYSGGKLTDWGAHLVDTAQVGNFAEQTSPVAVEGTATFPADALSDQPTAFDLRYRFANEVTMRVQGNGVRIRFEGEKGWIGVDGWDGTFVASDPALLKVKFEDAGNKLWPRPPREHRNFLDCIRSRAATTYPAEDLHRLSTTLHLGNIALECGHALRWDPAAESFDDAAANALRARPARDWAAREDFPA